MRRCSWPGKHAHDIRPWLWQQVKRDMRKCSWQTIEKQVTYGVGNCDVGSLEEPCIRCRQAIVLEIFVQSTRLYTQLAGSLTSWIAFSQSQDLFNLGPKASVFLLKSLKTARSLMFPAGQLGDLTFKFLDLLIVLAICLVSCISSCEELQVQLIIVTCQSSCIPCQPIYLHMVAGTLSPRIERLSSD